MWITLQSVKGKIKDRRTERMRKYVDYRDALHMTIPAGLTDLRKAGRRRHSPGCRRTGCSSLPCTGRSPLHHLSTKKSALIEVWKCNFPPFLGYYERLSI